MTHQRSPKAQLRREQKKHAKRLVSRLTFHGGTCSETVNILEPEQIREHLAAAYSEILVDVCQFSRGEVISDSRGKGTLQR